MKNRKATHLLFLLLLSPLFLFSQINYNANTTAPTFLGVFRVGFNFGDDYNWGSFTVQQLATIAANVGATTARPTMAR